MGGWRSIGLLVLGAWMLTAGLGWAAGGKAHVPLPSVVWVDDDGLDAIANGVTGAFKAIPDALRAVAPGGVVYVLPGLYDSGANINVTGGKRLIAMRDAIHPVNPDNDPQNSDWPVIIENRRGNAVQSYGGQSDITIRGFYIRASAGDGVFVQGEGVATYGVGPGGKKTALSLKINKICNHVHILGNRIENTYLDGIKVFACNDVSIVGNRISNTSAITQTKPFHLEQAIDFLAVANSVVTANQVLDNAIGIVVKGGSVNIQVSGNAFTGPFRWVAQSGEPVNDLLPYSSASSTQPWGARDIIVSDNVLNGNPRYADVAVDGCQSCSYIDNVVGGAGFEIVPDSLAVTRGLCIQGPGLILDRIGSTPIQTSNCPAVFPPATVVAGTPGGIDFAPGD